MDLIFCEFQIINTGADKWEINPNLSIVLKSHLQRRDHPLETLTKNNFVPVLKEALEVGVKDATVINGFRTTGLCPWNSEAINYKKCLGKGSKHDEEPKEDKSKLQEDCNKDRVMTRETLEKIVGQEKITFLQRRPLESLTETERILKKICCYFDDQTDASTMSTSQETVIEFLNIDQFPVILAEDFVDEKQAMNTANTNEPSANNTEDCLGSAQFLCLDSQQYLLTPVKLQDVLVTEKTPERKGVKNVERSSFVLTSAEWQKTENDKSKAKQLKEEEQVTRKKNRLRKQEEKNNAKVETTRNRINKKAKETIATKKQETIANKIHKKKENKIQEPFINHQHTVINHQVMNHDNNMPSSPENEHPSNIKKRKAEEQSMFPPNKKIKILSDIKLNLPNAFRTSQVVQRDDNQSDPLDKIINNKRKRNYSLLELEKILAED